MHDEEHIFGDAADGKTPRSYVACVSEVGEKNGKVERNIWLINQFGGASWREWEGGGGV